MRRPSPPPPAAELIGAGERKLPEEISVPKIEKVESLRILLEGYRKHLEEGGFVVSAGVVGAVLGALDAVPGEVSAVPWSAVRVVQVRVVVGAFVYRVLRDVGWYRKLLGLAERVVNGDRAGADLLRERIGNLFPVPEEVFPEAPDEAVRALEEIAGTVSEPGAVTALAARGLYEYMRYLAEREQRFLEAASRIDRVRGQRLVPVGEVARIAAALAPDVWRRTLQSAMK